MSFGSGKGHVLSINQFSAEDFYGLVQVANVMRTAVESGQVLDRLKGRVLACLFYEPSTRTFASFVAAMQRLGGSVIPIQGVTFSSVAKGETLEDTVRTLECYADAIVLRHKETGSAARAAGVIKKPLINAGDGIGEHPTQALLDGYTILGECPDAEHITMLGDLKHGRTVHSLVRLLGILRGRRGPPRQIHFVSPMPLQIPHELRDELRTMKVEFTEHEDLHDVLDVTDVLYVTRIQQERMDQAAFDGVTGSYVITNETLKRMKQSAIVMHPLPRVGEIAREVDQDPRAVYFKQAKYGLYMRMALLKLVLAPGAVPTRPGKLPGPSRFFKRMGVPFFHV